MHLTCKRAPVLPKIRILSFEITGAFDLFLNTDLCECVFPSVDNGMKKKERKVKRLAEPEMWLRSQCRGCCVEWNSAQAHKCTVCCTQFPHMFTLIHAENIHTCTLATSFFLFQNRQKHIEQVQSGNKTGSACVNDYQWFTGMIITGYSVFIYPHRSACYNSPDECSWGKLKAIESDATWCLILVAG